MNLLESLDQLCEPDLPKELIDLRNQWEKTDGGWIALEREDVNAEMLKNPDIAYWKDFLAGLAWTPEVLNKLDSLYDLLAKEGLITQDQAEESKRHKLKLSPTAQVREGKSLSAWLREEREFEQRKQIWRKAA
jgi:hypothetical protein